MNAQPTRVIVGDANFRSEEDRPVITVAGHVLGLRDTLVLGRDVEVCFSGYLELPAIVTVSVSHPDGQGFEKSMPLEPGKTLVISAFDTARTGFVASDRWPEHLFED